jgi:hypothetical protein
LGKKQNPIFKITRAKMDGGMAQAVEYLPSKNEVLSSTFNTGKKKKKQKTAGHRTIHGFIYEKEKLIERFLEICRLS